MERSKIILKRTNSRSRLALLVLLFHVPEALTVPQTLAWTTPLSAPRSGLWPGSAINALKPTTLRCGLNLFAGRAQRGTARPQHQSSSLGLVMQQSEGDKRENPRVLVFEALEEEQARKNAAGGPKEVSRRKFLSAVASIMIAVAGLSSSTTSRNAFAGDFEPSDAAPAESGLLIKMREQRSACSDGWAPNWRETGRASICLESDGCLWRKKDNVPRPFEQPFKEAAETYNKPFVGYLSRLILNFDPRWQEWWAIRQHALRADLKPVEVSAALTKDLNKFAGSLQYGLAKYTSPEGVRRLAAELQLHYGDLGEEVNHQLATAFSLLEVPNQPTEYILDFAKRGSVHDANKVSQEKLGELQRQAEAAMRQPLSRSTLPPLLVDQPLLRRGDGFEVAMAGGQEDAFGLKPSGPVTRERNLEAAIYGACAVSGLICCGLMHLAVTPLDVVKTRMQTTPRRYKGLKDGLRRIWREEGLEGLFSGVGPTVLGYSWYGLAVYPAYELFKRSFIAMVGEANDALYHVPLVLAAGACSTAIACLGVCPAEVVRIRTVSNPSYASGTLGVASKIVKEEGFFRGLYEGFSFLLTRQVLFGMVKFFVFDTFASSLFAAFPVLAEQAVTKLLVSLVAGAVAGVASTIVSQPADSVLTRMKDNKSVDAATVVVDIWNTMGPKGFFSGLASRCAWAGIIISGQFLLYDIGKNLLQITADDLTLFLDVIGSIELGSTLSGLK